jgi:peptidyl-prolyl cis-trans isomerase B (cyclophilin B)
VRNFVALARAGYYDGLEFDRTVREELEGAKGNYFEYLEAGCPLGTGEPGYGSIGYWMKPELSDKVKHTEGIVGAWHGEDLETAGCKFYITLSEAPWMDGNWTVFGKITRGLDVARTILRRPTRNDELKDRPVEPVVIRSVTIETREAD